MRYLSKDERREEILQAAMRVALVEGLSAMTVRRIAAEAGVATGQVHHHFTSGGELKSLAFVRLIRELLDAEVAGENVSWRERLRAMLGSDEGGFEPYIRLWRGAQILASRNHDIKGAYVLTMEMWHEKEVFLNSEDRKSKLKRFINFYNTVKPHKGLNGATPYEVLDFYFKQKV